ncbi:MAG: LCP family protein [Selenomonadaceae bacterium]|nr:LCP family protein [Selenomonadaceae bacterium]
MNVDRLEKRGTILNNSSFPPRNEGKKKTMWPWILALTCFLCAAIAGAIFASSSLLDKPKESNTVKKEELLTAKDKATIMIMGVDEREDDVGRSDTLMVATIDPDRDKAALLSIPRDTRVKIQKHGYDKINAAFAYGEEKLAQQTVEDFLGINIDYYVIINTRSFVKIIDAIGGIDINVEKRMYYEDPWDDDGGLLIDLMPGMQHMDGKTAVTYVRYRDEEGDIGRIERQQKFMKACMEQLTSPSILPKLPTIIQEVMDSVKTNLSMRQLLEFAGTLKSAQKYGLRTEMVPGRPLYIEGISYWIPDIAKMRSIVAETLGVTVSSDLRSRFERTAQEYEASIPSTATEVPEDDTSIGKAYSPSKESSGRTDVTDRTEHENLTPYDTRKKDSTTSQSRNDEDGLSGNPDIPKNSREERKSEAQEYTPSTPAQSPTASPSSPGETDSSVPTRGGSAGKTQ